MLLSQVAEKCGWEGYQIERSIDGAHLAGLTFQHPFCNRTGKFYVGDSFVENTTGTGFVHIAPGHGLEDYQLGLRNGLPVYSPVDDDGKLAHTADLPTEAQMPAELVGKSILARQGKSEANEAVLELLRSRKRSRFSGKLHSQLSPLLAQQNAGQSSGPWINGSFPWTTPASASALWRKINHVNWVARIWGKNRIEAAVAGRP